STDVSWPVTPITRRTAAGSVATAYPATRARPEVGRRRVARTDTVVVFPAPFGPSRASTWPRGASRLSRFTAVTAPRTTVSSARTTVGGGPGPDVVVYVIDTHCV